MEPARNRHSDDSMPRRQPVSVRRRNAIRRRIRKPRPQAGVRTAAIVMSDPPLKDPSEMPLMEWNHEVQTLAPDRAHQPFTEGIRLWSADRRSEDDQPHPS